MKKLVLVLLTCSCLSIIAKANGGTTIGSGGDALRELFANAKGVAANKVEQLNICSFDQLIPTTVRDWLLQNQTRLAMDIRLSQHAWVVDSQSTCGFTNHSPQSTIYLSYPTCASTSNTLNDATYILIHESAHHLGIDDEAQADEITRAVLNANIVSNCSSGSGVFDPNICSSAPMTTNDARKYFKPGDTISLLGKYKFYGQISRCVALSGCEPAKPWTFKTLQDSTTLSFTGLQLTATNSDPYFDARLAIGSSNGIWEYYPIKDGTLERGTQGYYLTFTGASYRNTHTFYVNSNNQLTKTSFRFGKDCLWSKWTQSFQLEGGVTEQIDIVLYGTH